MTNPKGIRRGTRYMFSKDFRKKGVIGLKTYFACYRKVNMPIVLMSLVNYFLVYFDANLAVAFLNRRLKRPFFFGTGLAPFLLSRSDLKAGLVRSMTMLLRRQTCDGQEAVRARGKSAVVVVVSKVSPVSSASKTSSSRSSSNSVTGSISSLEMAKCAALVETTDVLRSLVIWLYHPFLVERRVNRRTTTEPEDRRVIMSPTWAPSLTRFAWRTSANWILDSNSQLEPLKKIIAVSNSAPWKSFQSTKFKSTSSRL